ncbi:MAG TPA: hypothetical protein VHT91_07115 [Kofleriaceae bacterium]|jgi:hypothetical protein|nr:hypothetical protein [Kofleriaceae bacterium]
MAGSPADAADGPDTGSATQGVSATAIDDSFSVPTLDGCGQVDFVDYGAGAPGGGNNDDYVVIHDLCPDHHGVKAWAWLNGTLLGSKYNGNGLAGDPVIWDPFSGVFNVLKGDSIGLKVCLVDGTDDLNPSSCGSRTVVSSDG